MTKQQRRILNYLEENKSLNRLDAWSKLGILEAPARISELRSKGVEIYTEMVLVKNRFDETVRVARWHLMTADAPPSSGGRMPRQSKE